MRKITFCEHRLLARLNSRIHFLLESSKVILWGSKTTQKSLVKLLKRDIILRAFHFVLCCNLRHIHTYTVPGNG